MTHSEQASNLNEAIRSYLAAHRMCSAGNLALVFDRSPEQIREALDSLQRSGLIRIAQKSCSGGCAGCATDCSAADVNETAIIISLEKEDCEADTE